MNGDVDYFWVHERREDGLYLVSKWTTNQPEVARWLNATGMIVADDMRDGAPVLRKSPSGSLLRYCRFERTGCGED